MTGNRWSLWQSQWHLRIDDLMLDAEWSDLQMQRQIQTIPYVYGEQCETSGFDI